MPISPDKHPVTITTADREAAASAVRSVRAAPPRVHCVTNSVVQNFTANALLAFGAIPSMTINEAEIGDFVAGADALLLNLGTVDEERRRAIPKAVDAARQAGIPVVLDPVFVDRSPGRTQFARDLMTIEPDLVRANEAEWRALTGSGRTIPTEALEEGIVDLCRRSGGAAVLSGPTDSVISASGVARISDGDALMARVTGVGCVQSAIMASLAARSEKTFHAGLAGVLAFAECGRRAAAKASGPGTFEPHLLDALYALSPEDLIQSENTQ